MIPKPANDFAQEYLYIEEYDFECIPEDEVRKKQEDEKEKRGIIVIEIL